MLLGLLACAHPDDLPPPAEADVHIIVADRWSLADGAWLEQGDDGLALHHNGRLHRLAEAPLGVPAASSDGRRVAFAHRDDGLTISALELITLTDAGPQQRRLVDEGSPDRVAISEDGAWVAYVSGLTGIASVWAIPAEGGDAVQLTNVDLHSQPRTPGQPPAGFVAPPHAGPLRIVGDVVSWESPEGPAAVRLP